MGYKNIGDILTDIECTDKEPVGNLNKVTEIQILKITINIQFKSNYEKYWTES